MKIFKCLVAAVALLCSATSAMAQFDTDNYTRVSASFVSSKLTNTESFLEDNIDPKGINIGILQGLSVSDNLPLFLEIGANLTWLHSADDFGVGGDLKTTFMNFAIPLNMAYKYAINDKVAFSGHAGLNFKINMLGKLKADGMDDFSLLSKDDMGSRDARANIFQLGGQIGAGVHLADFYLGWQFQTDFMKYMENELCDRDKSRFIANFITLGYQGDIFGW